MTEATQGLSPEERIQYARHLALPEVGPAGQERLRNGSVLIVGLGGLGSPASMFLAAAGVGRLGLVEYDRVDTSNLQRQILYGTPDVGARKLEVAAQRLQDLNPLVNIDRHDVRLDRKNARQIIRDYDIVLDGTDNFATRYLVNDACVFEKKPNVYASVFRFEGQLAVFGAPGGPCYRCLFPRPPRPGDAPSCAEGGVLGVVPGIMGSMQAAEAIKLLLGLGDSLAGRLLRMDVIAMTFRTLRVRRNPDCAVCGDEPTIHELPDYEQFCDPVTSTQPAIDVRELRNRLDAGEQPLLLDVRSQVERDEFSIDPSLHIPLDELGNRMDEVRPGSGQTVIVYCRSGQRSALAVQMLQSAGIDALNLAGGVLAMRRED
jgi:sulfur-carrier protein adenylyltransferase/sulfurtransferase